MLPEGLARFAIRVTVVANYHESVQLGRVGVGVVGAGWGRLR